MGVVDEAAAAAVKAGMELFTYSVADSMIDLSGNGTVASREETPGLIVSMLSFTVDPFTLDFVRDWWGTSLIFFVMIALTYICAGGGFALLSTLYPDTAQRMNWITGNSGHFEIKEWISSVSLALIFPFLTYFGLYIILQLCWVVTALLSTTALDVIPLTADNNNIVIYIFMAITYLILSIIMGIRNIVIVIFCAGGLMLAALYLIPALRSLILNIFMYFLLLVFMQPLLVFIAAIGVMFIASLPPILLICKPSLLVALMILLLLTGIVLVFGYGTVSRMIGIVGRI